MKNVAILLTKKGLGHGPADLMELLLERYLKVLSEEPEVPRYLLMYSAGVEVARENSKYLPWLRTLEAKGCQIMLCGICIEYFGMKGQHPVGANTCINDIIKAMEVVEKVITV
jgi:intracellular sulfur oxidation DsrE/DsrF family protein